MNALKCVDDDDMCSLLIICTAANNVNKKKLYDLEEVDKNGNTALLKACYLGKTEFACQLIRFDANIKAINYFGQNALTLATHSGKIELVKELLKHRTYEDFNLSSIIPAICVAALRQHSALIQYFSSLNNENKVNHEDIQTVHGLNMFDIQNMLAEKYRRHHNHTAI